MMSSDPIATLLIVILPWAMIALALIVTFVVVRRGRERRERLEQQRHEELLAAIRGRDRP